MAIEFQCPSCSATVRVPDNAAGKKGSCPACKIKLIVPTLEDEAPPPAPVTPPPRSKAPSKPKPAPEKIISIEEPRAASKSKKPVEEFDLGLTPVAESKPAPKGKHAEPDFSSVLKIDVGGAPTPAPAPKAAPKPVREEPVAEVVPTAEVDEDIPEFMQQFVADNDDTHAFVSTVPRRPAKSGSGLGLIFGLLCGIGLIAGVLYLAMTRDKKFSGERLAYAVERGATLQATTIEKDEIDLEQDAIDNVLKTLAKNPVKITMESMKLELGSSRAGMEVSLREGDTTQFFRFPLDKEMRAYRDKHIESLDAERKKEFKAALKKFFEKCDVAIRNREGALPLDANDPRQVGLNACMRGFGYNVSALVPVDRGVVPYPCVFEDEANIYFLLPQDTKEFKLVGKKPDGSASEFPGDYHVKVRSPKGEGSESEKPAKASKEAEPEKMEDSSEGEMVKDKSDSTEGEMKKE